ncbi:hypothetical protein L1987_08485 [Smallanthus sonchifolius]|uniref:Uncharacterized protein n=1 Tax=Smallanthus sonchifolius TaxID=185202 RepID=A0ACB9JMH9_9ASTR|nr:hypothetical protein L1987_08485 [Smallanthus sonchifolius]
MVNRSGGKMESCQSSESGWTMYIGSSIDDDEGSGGGGGGYDGGRKKTVVENDDVDTDDSMASDASSGLGRGETEGNGRYNIKSKKYKKTMQKKKGGREEEKEVVNDKNGVVRSVQSRNSVWF